MNTPYTWNVGLNLTIECYSIDGFGATKLDCSFGGVRLPEITIPQNIEQVGFDTVRNQIEGLALEVIADALRLE